MNKRRLIFIFLSLITSGLLFLGSVSAFAAGPPDAPPLDLHAVFKTHIPHLNSSTGGSGTGSGPAASAPTATFGTSNYSVGSTVTPTTTGPEAEEHIAVDPKHAGNLVAAISDFSLRGGSNTSKYAISTDGGTKWDENFVPLDSSNFPATRTGSYQYNSDPVVAIDNAGNFYLANLYFNSGSGNNANGIYVGVGRFDAPVGVATTYPVSVQSDPSTNVDEDKEWIAVDNSASGAGGHPGRVYVSWTRFVGNSDHIRLSFSDDQGKTWGPDIQVSPASLNGAVQGSQVAVGPDGTVYVVYEVFYAGGKRSQFVATSVDGYATSEAITPLFNELTFNSTYRKNSFAALAVSPSGTINLVYSDQPNKTVGAQVEYTHGTIGGTFSAPVAINSQATGQQFMPAVTIDSSGTLHASWFDTRNSSTTSKYDIYATYSTNGGSTFAKNARVTTNGLVNAGRASFIGDYAGIAAGGGTANPVWTNGGFNGGKLQTATLTPVP